MLPVTYNKNERGFTLIELLVVISIIGILASVILASLSDAQRSARDSTRVQDMRQIRVALELFYNDHNRYPNLSADGVSDSGEFIGVGDDIDDALRKYINPVPIDPLHDGLVYYYSYDSLHNVDLDCTLPSAQVGLVYGFNRAEITGNLQKDTCLGNHMNLDTADYNQAVVRSSN